MWRHRLRCRNTYRTSILMERSFWHFLCIISQLFDSAFGSLGRKSHRLYDDSRNYYRARNSPENNNSGKKNYCSLFHKARVTQEENVPTKNPLGGNAFIASPPFLPKNLFLEGICTCKNFQYTRRPKSWRNLYLIYPSKSKYVSTIETIKI